MKCNIASRDFCQGMRLALTGVPDNGEGRGLYLSVGWKGKASQKPEGRPKICGINYTPHEGDDIVLNFCPWCQADLRRYAKTDVVKETQGEE